MRVWGLLVAVLAGCVAGERPEPVEPPNLEFATQLELHPGRLHFRSVPVGEARARSVTVRNLGRTSATLTSATLEGSAFRLLTTLPLVVPAEEERTLLLEASAEDATPREGTLRLATDNALQASLELPLLLNREAPCVTSEPARLNFAPVEVGCPGAGARVRLVNACAHPVRLGATALSPGFVVTSFPATRAIPPRGEVELLVAARPAQEGSLGGFFASRVDVLDGEESVSVPLSSQATPPRFAEETFVAPSRPQVDVLFVVDDSPAMVPLAASVAQNVGDLARSFSASESDWRFGVLTTSTAPGAVGRLRRAADGAGWLERPLPAATQALAAVRGASSGRSSCLEALLAAFSPPLATDATELGGFLRPGAGLQVVCVTNGRDEAEAAPQEAISRLLGLLPPLRLVFVVAHLIDDSRLAPGCGAALEHGPLSSLAAQFGGVREEICTPNWAAALQLGPTAFGARLTYRLSAVPDLLRRPLEVSIAGLQVPSVDPALRSELWRYDGALNAVVLEPLYEPPPDTTLRVRYVRECSAP